MKVLGQVLRFVFVTVPGVVLGAIVTLVYFGIPFLLLDAVLSSGERKRKAAAPPSYRHLRDPMASDYHDWVTNTSLCGVKFSSDGGTIQICPECARIADEKVAC